jgi:hypothetical protein
MAPKVPSGCCRFWDEEKGAGCKSNRSGTGAARVSGGRCNRCPADGPDEGVHCAAHCNSRRTGANCARGFAERRVVPLAPGQGPRPRERTPPRRDFAQEAREEERLRQVENRRHDRPRRFRNGKDTLAVREREAHGVPGMVCDRRSDPLWSCSLQIGGRSTAPPHTVPRPTLRPPRLFSRSVSFPWQHPPRPFEPVSAPRPRRASGP